MQTRLKSLLGVSLAILLAFSVLGISIIVIPQDTEYPIPGPQPSLPGQIAWAALWMGLASLFAVAIVGVVLVSLRIKQKKT